MPNSSGGSRTVVLVHKHSEGLYLIFRQIRGDRAEVKDIAENFHVARVIFRQLYVFWIGDRATKALKEDQLQG